MNAPKVRWLFGLVYLCLLSSLCAQTAAPAKTGTIRGRITDSTSNITLEGVRVTLVPAGGGALEAYTQKSGEYSFFNVPAGKASLTFSYVGYDDITRAADVIVGKSAQVDVNFGWDVTMLEEMTVTGSLIGTARALNQQRAAQTFTNIIAADDIGRFPDQNAAESLQRVPGVAIYRDQGEGRFIVLRGIRPDQTSVSLNGVGVASPERGNRQIALDVIPSESLGAIEVTKVPTPDMSADGIGGVVNMKGRSAFDSDGTQLNVAAQGQYSHLTDETGYKLATTAGKVFMKGKLGVLISASEQKRSFGSNNFEEGGDGWNLNTGLLNGIAFRQYEIERHRTGANANIEFKPDADTQLFFRTTFSRFEDNENRYIAFIPFSEASSFSDVTFNSATAIGVRRERRDVRVREKNQDLAAFVLGGEKRIGGWELDAHLGFSNAKEGQPGELQGRFRKSTRGTNWTYSFANGTYSPVVTQTAGASLTDPASYATYNELSRLRLIDSTGRETEWSYAFNAKYALDLASAVPGYVKFGVLRREKNKAQARESADHHTGAPTSIFNYAAFAEPQPDYPFYGTHRANASRFENAFYSNRSLLTPARRLADSQYGDWTSTENVNALYGMLGVTLKERLNLIAGVRYEDTEFDSRGFEPNGTVIVPVSRSKNYDNLLPGLYARYDWDKETTLRASFSSSLARPRFEESTVGRRIINSAIVDEYSVGNPQLKPLESTNLDASVERYLPSLGLFSAGIFHKEIKNFTYSTYLGGNDPIETGVPLLGYVNGDSGNITGIELAYQQQFRTLPAPWDGLGFAANYTYSQSRAKYPSRPGEKLPFIGQSTDIGNIAFSYDKKGLFLRLAANFRSPRMREDEPIGSYNPNASTPEPAVFARQRDRWVDDFFQLDFNSSYKLTSQWEVFAEVLNITDAPFRAYFGRNGTRLVQYEEYGVSTNFGIRWNL
jgi:TonB-dependent receptor